MLHKLILRRGMPLLLLAALSSCSAMRETDKLEYAYAEGYNHRKLVLSIPDGYASETHERKDNGVLIRTFHYADGAEFFIACKDNESKPVIAVEKTSESLSSLVSSVGEQGSGKHNDGTSWRRSVRDCFIIGYNFVKPDRAKLFEQSIQTLKVRRG